MFTCRRDFFDNAEEHLSNVYYQIKENKKLEKENNLLKTYVLENNISNFSTNELIKSIKTNFYQTKNGKKIHGKLIETDESNFFSLSFDNIELYMDFTSQDRFCHIYTLGDALTADKILKNALYGSLFDSLWLWNDFLKGIQDNKGLARGFGLDYDYRRFDDSEENTNYIKMQIFGGEDTRNIYELLSNADEIKDKIILSRVGVKVQEQNNVENFMIETVKYSGKITSKGTSIDEHLKFVREIKEEYSDKLNKIEDRYRLDYFFDERGNFDGIRGNPIYFRFAKELSTEMMDSFMSNIFNGSAPFRLMGFPYEHNKYGRFIEVVDMHIGENFAVELYPDILVMYLSRNICGNTVMRFYTNLQHYFSKKIEVCDDNEQSIF